MKDVITIYETPRQFFDVCLNGVFIQREFMLSESLDTMEQIHLKVNKFRRKTEEEYIQTLKATGNRLVRYHSFDPHVVLLSELRKKS